MTRTRHQIIGLCRFSYPSIGGFAGPEMSVEETERQLYAPRRIERRFAMFETLTLPSLAAQTDADFRLVVLIGRSLPMRHKNRLRDLAEQYSFLRISQQEPAGPLVSTRKGFRRGIEEDTEFVTGFRIDDDDAVAVDYIELTRQRAEALLQNQIADTDNPAVISFHRGIYWDLNDPENPFHDVKEKAPLGLASAMLAGSATQANIFRWNHRHLAAHTTVLSDPREIMFLRTLHQSNNSDRKVPPGAERLKKTAAGKLLKSRFGIDPAAALALMETTA